MDNKRNYGIDLLRIVSMIMICTLHVLGHGGILKYSSSNTLNYYGVWLLEEMCICAVNCYALISGYVSVGREYKYKKIIYFWLAAFFYSFSICFGGFLLCSILDIGKSITIIELVQSFFPITFGNWYFSSYFLLFLMMPYVDKCMNSMNKNKYPIILLIVVLLSVICSFGNDNWFDEGHTTLWLMVMYITGYILKRMNIADRFKKSSLFSCYLFFTIITFILNIGLGFSRFGRFTSISVVMSAIFLLLLFSKINVESRFIKVFSPLTFGIYLFHDNRYVRELFISEKFFFLNNYNVFLEVLITIVISLFVFFSSSLVEYARFYVFKKISIYKLSDHIYKIISNTINKITKNEL